jgi:hypothetical protein
MTIGFKVPSCALPFRSHAIPGDRRSVLGILKRQFYQSWVSYGLRRDLDAPCAVPEAKIPIAIRELRDSDVSLLLEQSRRAQYRHERLEIAQRLRLIAEDIPTCYVAVHGISGEPCFFQWLLGPEQNERIHRFFSGRFPALKQDEALLENAYTLAAFRGLGIMSQAMSLISEKAHGLGCRYVLTFVDQENSASLKGCARAGFAPYMIRRDSHALCRLIRRRRFETPLKVMSKSPCE